MCDDHQSTGDCAVLVQTAADRLAAGQPPTADQPQLVVDQHWDAEEGSSSAAEDLSLAADQSLISDLEYDESFVDAVLKDANIFHDSVVDILDLTTRGVNGEIGDGCEGLLIRTAEVADTMVTNRQDPGVGQSQPRTVSPVAARGSAAVLPSDLTLRRKRKRSSSASRMHRRKMAAGSESDQSSDIRTSVPQKQECHHNMPVLF